MPVPLPDLERRLAAQTWTAHNLDLGDGIHTMPGREDFLSSDTRLQAIERSVGALVGDLSGRRVLDLGSLEGGFAVAMARHGASVVAVEARPPNVAKIELLRDHFGLDQLEIVEADVNQVSEDPFGRFDVVLALGILYHLDDPVRWLAQIAQLTDAVLIVDTHLAPPDDLAMARLRSDLRHLGSLEVHIVDGTAYDGRWYTEFPPTIGDASREQQLWASWANNRSFWLTEESLLCALLDAGFDLVLEQHDLTARAYRTYSQEYPRAMYVCTRSSS